MTKPQIKFKNWQKSFEHRYRAKANKLLALVMRKGNLGNVTKKKYYYYAYANEQLIDYD